MQEIECRDQKARIRSAPMPYAQSLCPTALLLRFARQPYLSRACYIELFGERVPHLAGACDEGRGAIRKAPMIS
jgi:hypothetical protein